MYQTMPLSGICDGKSRGFSLELKNLQKFLLGPLKAGSHLRLFCVIIRGRYFCFKFI